MMWVTQSLLIVHTSTTRLFRWSRRYTDAREGTGGGGGGGFGQVIVLISISKYSSYLQRISPSAPSSSFCSIHQTGFSRQSRHQFETNLHIHVKYIPHSLYSLKRFCESHYFHFSFDGAQTPLIVVHFNQANIDIFRCYILKCLKKIPGNKPEYTASFWKYW